MNPLSMFGAGAMPMSLSNSSGSDGQQGGQSFNTGAFNVGKTSNTTLYLIGGLAVLAAFVFLAKR